MKAEYKGRPEVSENFEDLVGCLTHSCVSNEWKVRLRAPHSTNSTQTLKGHGFSRAQPSPGMFGFSPEEQSTCPVPRGGLLVSRIGRFPPARTTSTMLARARPWAY